MLHSIVVIAVVTACLCATSSIALAADEAKEPASEADSQPAGSSPEFLAWLQICVQHLASEDEDVRGGAAVALKAAGPAARPLLEMAAANDHPQLSAGAKRLLAQMDRSVRGRRSPGQPAPPGYRQGRSTVRVLDALELDDEKRAAVEPLLAQSEKQRQELIAKLQSGEVERSEAGSRLGALRKETDEKLAELLDEAQMERYRELTRAPARTAPRPTE
jgi:hypothetical protein